MHKTLYTLSGIIFITIIFIACGCNTTSLTPVRVVAEMNIGESQDIKLSNGETINLRLIQIRDIRDSLRDAIRAAYVTISVDGEEITLSSGNYNLPVSIGKIQIDCPVTKSYYTNSHMDWWELQKDARLRIWPKGSSYIQPGTFVYPVRQKWFASKTQTGNEPSGLGWGEEISIKKIYYHAGHDIGGAEGMDEIVSATDGLVVSANKDTLEGYDDFPGDVRTDVVYIVDSRGWYYRYSHLDSTDPSIKPGAKIRMGQKIGLIGKQGGSGGWVHLHFGISNKETSTGNWGTEDAYVYAWESYVRQYKPKLIAVARPHHLVWTGQETILDGRKSKSFSGDIVTYEWSFSDGSTGLGPVQKRKYEKPGEYSEILKITDSEGNVDYDFTNVYVHDRMNPEISFPTIQAAYHPSLNIKPGQPVTFLVRTFDSDVSNEEWDFGDGSTRIKVKSEKVTRQEQTKGKFAETVHSFSKPGHYIVKVESSDDAGYKAITHLHVVVDE